MDQRDLKITRKGLIKTAIALIAAIAIILLLDSVKEDWRIRTSTLKSDSEYRVIYEEHLPSSRIGDRDWFVADGRIFVLFEKQSYLNVYDLEGAFLYSIQTYHINNGAERIAYKDGLLIIHTRSGGVYLFDGSEKKEYIPWDRDNKDEMERSRTYYNYIEREFSAKKLNQEAYYYLENNTIYHLTDEGESESVLSFPISYFR